MAICRIVIPLKLPSCNEYINECRKNKYAGAKMKRETEAMIGCYLIGVPKFTKPVKIHFTWIEGSKRRDLDGICFAKKFILDSLVKYGKLKDDNRNCVYAFTDKFAYGNTTKVILEIEELKDDK
jgi:Holliday junction resolvase RusA-like endonuclease